MDKDKLHQLIERKREVLSQDIEVITPRDEVASEVQADWLIQLLSKMYTEHGITKKREVLISDIENKKCRLWFAAKDNLLVGSAALITQDDGSCEVGRAVAFEQGVGGLLMLMAAEHHVSKSSSPLMAEVRISDNFLGVPSGEATQIICFRHLGLTPNAVLPAFNHGNPVRQEMFVFSSSEALRQGEVALLPGVSGELNKVVVPAVNVVKSGDGSLNFRVSSERSGGSGWSLVEGLPFSLMLPDNNGTSVEVTLREAESRSAFTLVPLSTGPDNLMRMTQCLEKGFVPCGFDRTSDEAGFPVILMGKLRRGTMVAPIKIVSGLLETKTQQAIQEIDRSFRNG